MSQVPAATRTLRVLKFLARQPDPVPLDRIPRACGLPRSTAYHLLHAMVEEGFVVHLADEHRYGLGSRPTRSVAATSRQEPLHGSPGARSPNVVRRAGQNAHFAVLHGRDVLYVVEERASGRPSLVTDVGVRLPGPPDRQRTRHPGRRCRRPRSGRSTPTGPPSSSGTAPGPPHPSALRAVLAETRQRGHAVEDGEVTPGLRERGGRGPRPLRPPGGRGRAHLREPRRLPCRAGRRRPCRRPPR